MQPVPETRDERERRLWPRATHVERLRFRRAPLLFAAVLFALGEGLSRVPPALPRLSIVLALSAAALVALTLLCLRRTLRLVLLPLAALWMLAGLWSLQIAPAPATQTALPHYADGLSRNVRGRITRVRALPPRQPQTSSDSDFDGWDQPAGEPNLSVDLDLTAIEEITPDISRMAPIAGGLRVTLLADGAAAPVLHCGASIEAPMRLRLPERYRDPGAWQYADYLLQQGIAATAAVPASRLQIDNHNAATSLRCRIFAAQTWASARLDAFASSHANRTLPAVMRLSPDDAGMLNAMLFGDRTRLSHTLRLGFERTGSFHLFVVSGMHVALLAGILFWLARRLRLGERASTLLTLSLISAYALLTGFGVPVQRALLMTVVFLLARLLSRSRSELNSLGAAALAVLVWTPRALFDSSFQMTFLAIVAIAGIAIPLGERSFLRYAAATRHLDQSWRDASFPPRLAQFRVMLRLWGEPLALRFGPHARRLPATALRLALWLAELALIGIVAEAVMVLPMALYFHRATVFALPANLLSIPLVGVLAPLGLITFLASLASPWLAMLPSAALALLLHAITGAIGRIGHTHAADLRLAGPTLAQALIAAACFAFCCWAVRRSRALAAVAIGALVLAVGLVLWPSPPQIHPGQLEVTAIDVGQGDSLLIVGPNGRTMLLDAGGPTGAAANAENARGTTTFDIGEEVVSPYLWSRHIQRIDTLVLSHAHSDHMGGMAAVMRNFRPRELWVGIDPNSDTYRALLAEAAEYGVKVRHLHAGDLLTWDALNISVLAPEPWYRNPGPPANNDSLVLRMVYGRASALLEGDAEGPSEHAMVDATLHGGPPLGPDTLLKVGHHGSRTSTTPEFLALAEPLDAVISVGKQNTFGHPRPEIIQRLADAHARVFRTDRFGATTFLLTPEGRISAAPQASNP